MMEGVKLLPQIIQTFREVCDILAREESLPELKKFYLHVSARTFILLNLQDESREAFASSLAGTHLSAQLLYALDRVVDREHVPESLTLPAANPDLSTLPGLSIFLQLWGSDSSGDEKSKLSFARRYLDFGSRQRQDDLIGYLKEVEEVCRANSKVGRSDLGADQDLCRRLRELPPLDISPLAQSVYSALSSSKTDLCETCKVPHGYSARLCIETHRAQHFIKGCDFDMFLGLDQLWHEARVRSIGKSTVRSVGKSTVRFIIDGDDNHEKTKQKNLDKGRKHEAKVENLCRQIKESQRRWMFRLNFEVRDNELWKIPSERSKFIVDASEEAISLSQFMAEKPHVLNGKTKRILSVLLAYAVLHLYGTGWIEPTLCSDDILFFKTSGAVPLKPYLHIQLRPKPSERCPINDGAEAEDESEADPDDELFYHPYPCLVNLALMLIELHQARPIESIARENRLEISADMTNEDRFLVAGQIFASCEHDFEDQTRMAIDACLDVSIGGDADNGLPDEDALRRAIYQNIVRRLEDELEQGHSYISVEGLDVLAQTLDFARFGRPIKSEQPDDSVRSMVPQSRAPSHKRASNDEMGGKRCQMRHRGPVGSSTKALGEKWVPDKPRLSFFDDQRRPEWFSPARKDAYVSWKESVREVYRKFLPQVAGEPRVKIVVLDTGIDKHHPDIYARDDQIKKSISYVDKDRRRVHDSSGHGTHVTSLLLDYAPEADIYIVKIAEQDPAPSQIIALAINDAVKDWNPDIISMSFGWPSRDDGYEQLEDALKSAQFHNVLLFAAASNDGANAKRAWPARHPGVIYVTAQARRAV